MASITAPPIRIEYVPDPSYFVQFNDFKLKSFSDTLSTKWNSEEVFGRMDPIMTYQGTGRKITLAFDLGTSDVDQQAQYLAMVSRLMQFQYPVYENASNALSLARPPLIRVSFGNYIRGAFGGGLLCAMQGMSYNPSDDSSMSYKPYFKSPDGKAAADIIPKRISVNLELVVLHEQTPGFADVDEKGINWIGGDQWAKVDYDGKYGGADPITTMSQGYTKDDIPVLLAAEEMAEAEAAARDAKIFEEQNAMAQAIGMPANPPPIIYAAPPK